MRARFVAPAFLLIAIVVTVGCDSGPKIVKVAGIATYKSEPIPSLLIQFQPAHGRPSWGITDENGRFELEYDAKHKGAVIGKHTVSAIYRARTPEEEMGGGKRHPAIKPITEKYGDTMNSPLKIDITEPVENLEVKYE
jgi:hypothetical protein